MYVLLFDLVYAVSAAIGEIDSEISHHHEKLAYIALEIANEISLPEIRKQSVILSALLHDCGILSAQEKINILNFDSDENFAHRHRHAYRSSYLLEHSKIFYDISKIIKYHHVYWNEKDLFNFKESPPIESHIIHLADRIDILLKQNTNKKNKDLVINTILANSGCMFMPLLVDAFKKLAERDSFWANIDSANLKDKLKEHANLKRIFLNIDSILDIAKVFYKIIDFRSRFTSSHSAMLAACTLEISKLMKFSEYKQKVLQISALLHDLGKISVPLNILNKTSSLSPEEQSIMRRHPYKTFKLLSTIQGLEMLSLWASYHHERLDGSGYPFHLKEEKIPLEARIIAVSDVFTALIEDRPYRSAMPVKKALSIINNNASLNKLDKNIVNILNNNLDTIYEKMQIAHRYSLEHLETYLDTDLLFQF